jgi:hypothetical protein
MKSFFFVLLLLLPFISSTQDLAIASLKRGEMGFINREGEFVIKPQYDKVKQFDSGIALVLKDDNWHYINKEGSTIENFPKSDKLYDFSNGLAIFRKDEKVGMFNNKGEIIIEPIYQNLKPYSYGAIEAKLNDKWGYIDGEGNILIEFNYKYINEIYKGITWGYSDGQFGVISNNEFLTSTDNSAIVTINDYYMEGLVVVRVGKYSSGVINSDIELVVDPRKYYSIKPFRNGLAAVEIEHKWGFINLEEKIVIDAEYEYVESFSSDGIAPVMNKKAKWGFINKEGELILPYEYSIFSTASIGIDLYYRHEIGFNNGLARVKTKKGWTFINKEGQPIGGKWFRNLEFFN